MLKTQPLKISQKVNRKRVTFTMLPDTIIRLNQIAKEYHTTKSQALTDLIWSTTLPSETKKKEKEAQAPLAKDERQKQKQS